MAKLDAEHFPHLPELTYTDYDCTSRDGTTLSLRAWRRRSSGDQILPIVYLLHGGGWSYGGHQTESSMIHSFALQLGCVTVTIEYRLAPEHAFPTPFYDAYDGLLWVRPPSLQ